MKINIKPIALLRIPAFIWLFAIDWRLGVIAIIFMI